MKLVKSIKKIWEQGGVVQGEITLFSQHTFQDETFDFVMVEDLQGSAVDITLYELGSEKEVVLSYKDRELLIEELKC